MTVHLSPVITIDVILPIVPLTVEASFDQLSQHSSAEYIAAPSAGAVLTAPASDLTGTLRHVPTLPTTSTHNVDSRLPMLILMQQTIKMPSPEVNPLQQKTLQVPTRSVLGLTVTANVHHASPVIDELFNSNTQTRFSIGTDNFMSNKPTLLNISPCVPLGTIDERAMYYNRRFKQARVTTKEVMIRLMKEHLFMQDLAKWVALMRNLLIRNVVFVTQRYHPPWNMANG